MKKSLLLVAVFGVCNLLGQVPAFVPTLNLVAYYPFNGTVNDASGNNHNGTATNITATTDRFSNSNSAYSFNGSSSGIQLNTTNTVSFPTGVTYCAWISAVGFTNSSVVDDMDGTLNPDIGFRLNVRSLSSPTPVVHAGRGWYGLGIAAQSTSQYSLNTWHFIAASWGNDDSLRVYFNGVQQQAIYAVYNYTNSLPIYIGRGRLNAGYEVFNGKIDDVSIHSRVLTKCEIYSMYTGTTMTMPLTGVSNTICAGTTLTLTASGLNTYTWNGSSVSNSFVTSPVSNQTYTITGKHTLSGCTISSFVPIAVNPLPAITINGPANICQGNTLILTASGGNTYSWNTGSNTASISSSPTITSIYSVVATNSNGCVNSNSVSVQVNPLPSVSVSANSNTLCAGQTATLSASGAATYTWSTNQNGGSISVSPSMNTTFSVTGTNSLSCANSAAITITVNTLPTIAIQGSSIICSGETTTLTAFGANSYTWSSGQNIAAISVSPSVTTNYSVVGTDINGCSNSAVTTQSVSDCTGLDQQSESFSLMILIFPNPNNGRFTIISEKEIHILILNSMGQTIRKVYLNSANNLETEISDLKNGIYYLINDFGNEVISKRIVVY